MCDVFERLSVSLNAVGSTSTYFAAAGVVCSERPHLAGRLLVRPVEGCLVIGAVSAADVIRGGVAVSHDPWYAALAGPDGVQWLREQLPHLTGLVQRLVEERRAALAAYRPISGEE